MKNRLLGLFFLLVGFSFTASAQLGAGLVFGDETGLNARYKIGVTEQIDVVPQVTYFFVSDVTVMDFGANAHYNFEVGDGFMVYPLAGLSLAYAKAKDFDGDTELFFTFGGGATYAASDMFNLFGELRFNTLDGRGLELAVGSYFNF